MFEQTFKNIDDTLHKDAGCSSDAAETLGSIPIISNAFVGCQKYLYE